jgi:hypothetical protein
MSPYWPAVFLLPVHTLAKKRKIMRNILIRSNEHGELFLLKSHCLNENNENLCKQADVAFIRSIDCLLFVSIAATRPAGKCRHTEQSATRSVTFQVSYVSDNQNFLRKKFNG